MTKSITAKFGAPTIGKQRKSKQPKSARVVKALPRKGVLIEFIGESPSKEWLTKGTKLACAAARARVIEVFQRLTTLKPAALGTEELTPEELPFLRFEAAAQARFDAWRGDVEQTLRAEAEHPVWRSHVAKYRSLMPSLALIGHLIDGVAGGPTGPVSGGAAARAVAWCEYLQGHARRLYASVMDFGPKGRRDHNA